MGRVRLRAGVCVAHMVKGGLQGAGPEELGREEHWCGGVVRSTCLYRTYACTRRQLSGCRTSHPGQCTPLEVGSQHLYNSTSCHTRIPVRHLNDVCDV